MRMSDIDPKANLFEMPYLTSSNVDWGLHTVTLNKHRMGVLLHTSHEVLIDNDDGKLIRSVTPGGGQFAFISNGTNLIEYYMLYVESSPTGLGRCASQVKLWNRASPYGLTGTVFFKFMLGVSHDTMISDGVQTSDGRRFWIARLVNSLTSGRSIGIIDHDVTTIYDPATNFDDWLASVDGWGDDEKHRSRRFLISNLRL